MGFLLSSLALLMLYGAIQLYRMYVAYRSLTWQALRVLTWRFCRFFQDDWASLYAAVAGYGLGARRRSSARTHHMSSYVHVSSAHRALLSCRRLLRGAVRPRGRRRVHQGSGRGSRPGTHTPHAT